MDQMERYKLAVEKVRIRLIQSEIVFGELHTQEEILAMLERMIEELEKESE